MLELLKKNGWAPEVETVEEIQGSMRVYLEKSGVDKSKELGAGDDTKPQKEVV